MDLTDLLRRHGSARRSPDAALVRRVQGALTPQLVREQQKGDGTGPLAGHCYVAAQALWHLLGADGSGWTPVSATVNGTTHWWLEDADGRRLDPTAEQFPDGFPYEQGTRRGFLTKEASKRATVVIGRVLQGSRATARVHGMKLDPWTRRLIAGVRELQLAQQEGQVVGVIDGIDDVSFWTGRVVCDAFGATGTPQTMGDAARAGRAVLTGQAAVVGAKQWLTEQAGQGSANVATGSGYHRTAIATGNASAPLRHLIARHPDWVKGRVLDFGTGRGRDCKALGKRRGVEVSCYDPYHPQAAKRSLPSGVFDLVIANYVVNVLPSQERRAAVRQMASKVKKGGVLVVAARGCGDKGGRQTAAQWGRHGDGRALFADDGALERFQRFYTDGSLQRELRDILGPGFTALDLTPTGSDLAMVALRRGR